jgi:aromatic-L-amino-acid decarboxylase
MVAFRPHGAGDEESAELLRRVNASNRVWLSSGVVGGRTFLRMCILSHRSRRGRIEEALEIIAAAAAERP